MYKIKIKDIEIFGYHGLYQHEKENGQIFIINLEYVPVIDINEINDEITRTIDYISIVDLINDNFNVKRFNLLESLAADLMKKINSEFKLQFLKVNILKKIDINSNFSVEINLDNE